MNSMLSRIATIGVGMVVAFSPSPVAGQSRFPLEPVVDRRIDSLAAPLAGTVTPGLAVLVVHRGAVLHARAYGIADQESGEAFRLDTPFYIASLGKMFTAFVILKLIEDGKLSFDTRLGDVLPTAPRYAHGVTIRQLLTHQSGLIDHFDVGGEDRRYTTADVMAILAAADSLMFQPGSRSAYSNSAYVLLAQIITRFAGQEYAAHVRKTLFEPAGMMSSVVITSPALLPARRARGHTASAATFIRDDFVPVDNAAVGAGDIYSTIADLYRWAMALRSGQFISSDRLETASTEALRSNGRPTPWGMGWLAEFHGARDPLAGKRYVASVGIFKGFRALFKWYQQDDLVIIWLANTNSNQVMDRLEAISRLVFLVDSDVQLRP